ncbi:putative low complexity coiled coil [Cryptosporidium sp. chipmunk genotype I]|uniref:putative low complexity coiled coil n=1 Tax=Cryptosporidium sp. chipmunk genotype I TaxID=1280935 RepID=UPI00351A0B87|nr:putative low complexity coiled coil [Cryptosporidium sp. chipmunk genotype I]
MPENCQKNIGKGSKISDLSSKIRDAESDLSISRGIKLRNNNIGNNFKPINGLVFDKSGQDLKEVSELHILRLKQIETAQRLKETLRRNVDLMTELQKARGVVRSLEKKISLLERGEGINLFRNGAKDTNSPCNHCPKQQEEINKLKLHIIELNDTFQKRWDDTQKELINAKNSLSDVSNKLLDSLNNNHQMKISQETEKLQSISRDYINESIEDSLQFDDKVIERYKSYTNNTNNFRNGSEAQSPSTYKLSRPSSSNFSNDLNIRHENLNAYSRINSNNFQYSEYPRQSETPRASFANTYIRDQFLTHNQKSDPNVVIKHSRPQSENLIKYPVLEANRNFPNSHNNSNSGFYRTNNGANCDSVSRIRSLDSITINPGFNSHANSFPPGFVYNVSNRKYDLNSRDSISNSLPNPMVYPNNYSSNILSSHNKIQTPNSSFASGVEMLNSSKTKNSLLPGSNNTSYDSHFDNNSIIQNQIECENPTGISNYNSYSVNESNNIQNSMSPSSHSKTIIEPVKDQTVNNYSTSLSDNFNEYPSSPVTKGTLNELEIDQNTYGNIRRTLEELKKTQDQRVQQLKDDREKLLRAVLNDLQEMKDFKTSLNSIKENQEKMIKTAPKGLFSLEDSSKYGNI